ncbi:MAG: tetratricopeptide repeat protein [Bacteroidetes bacterium]|nr:tetratricopeptide repeat protein [Bacteroidota bacterium]
MTNQDIQTKIETSTELLNESRTFFETSDYDEYERSANEVVALLEPFAECNDLGEERDENSQKYKVVKRLVHAYNRLSMISQQRSDYALALRRAEIAIEFCERIGELSLKADLILRCGNVYRELSDLVKSLENFQNALTLYEELGSKSGVAPVFVNIGTIYGTLRDYDKALEYFQKALTIYDETGIKDITATLINIGHVYFGLADYAKALEYSHKALALNEELGHKSGIAQNLLGIGCTYQKLTDYDKALEYMYNALSIFEEWNNKTGIALTLGNIGETYLKRDFSGYDAAKAEEYLSEALAVAIEIGSKYHIFQGHEALAKFYDFEKRWEDFAIHYKKYHNLKEEVQSDEAKKAANLMEQRRQAAEREKQYAIERARAQATEELLHKTLPKSIADRVIKGEERIADHFQSASILFADVVGFTKISAQMPPAAVLAFMNFIFEHFDALAAKHGCERIKTIGDGYMAVCGAPVRYPNHAQRLASMALDMMEDIILPEEIRKHLPKGTVFHLRIGLHCGEITAGLIGTGKLAYDIYGDAVNTAARMESHGEPDRIHVSEDFAFHLQNRMDMTNDDLGGITFEEREEIEIKGKGKMKTYFLEKA